MNSFYRDGSYKYGNRKTTVNGKKFDSGREARRYEELLLLERAGEILELRTQVRFELIPAQRGPDGKIIEHSCNYYADFAYLDKRGNLVVEDAKGYQTEAYKIKRKLMLKVHGIRVKEV